MIKIGGYALNKSAARKNGCPKNCVFSRLAIEEQEAERRRVSRELHHTVLPLVRNTEAAAWSRYKGGGITGKYRSKQELGAVPQTAPVRLVT
jgi:hypothetical protein